MQFLVNIIDRGRVELYLEAVYSTALLCPLSCWWAESLEENKSLVLALKIHVYKVLANFSA